MTAWLEVYRLLALLALLLALGCNGSTGHSGPSSSTATSSPTTPSPPPAPSAQVYTISVVGSGILTGPVGVFTGPLAVEVRDAAGKLVDGVNVNFQPSAATPPLGTVPYTYASGPWGLGETLSGDGMWTVSPPGSGVAAVGCTPAIKGSVTVWATVVPVVASYAQPPASSNVVYLSVVGQ